MFLSLVLAAGSLWCVGLVQQVHSEEKAEARPEKFTPVAPMTVLTESQEEALAELRAAASASPPKFKAIEMGAEFLAEFFNVKQFAEKADPKAAARGRDQALDLAKAAKAKDAEAVKKLLDPLGESIKKSGSPDAGSTAPAEPYKPVAKVHPLMEEQQDMFDGMKKLLNAGAADDLKKVEKHALVLAELSNINRHQQKDKADYVDWATQARDTSVKLAKAAGANDTDTAKGILRQLHTTCTSCHDKYQ
jgi:hypothetical protein